MWGLGAAVNRVGGWAGPALIEADWIARAQAGDFGEISDELAALAPGNYVSYVFLGDPADPSGTLLTPERFFALPLDPQDVYDAVLADLSALWAPDPSLPADSPFRKPEYLAQWFADMASSAASGAMPWVPPPPPEDYGGPPATPPYVPSGPEVYLVEGCYFTFPEGHGPPTADELADCAAAQAGEAPWPDFATPSPSSSDAGDETGAAEQPPPDGAPLEAGAPRWLMIGAAAAVLLALGGRHKR